MRFDYDQMQTQYESDRLRRSEVSAGGSLVLGWVIIGLFVAWVMSDSLRAY